MCLMCEKIYTESMKTLYFCAATDPNTHGFYDPSASPDPGSSSRPSPDADGGGGADLVPPDSPRRMAMAWSAASAVKPHQGSVLTKCPSSAAPPASFVSSRSSMATNAQLPGPLRNFFSQSVISNGLHGMSQRRFPMSCVFVRCDVQPMYEIRRRSSARCTLSLSGFCRRQSDDSTTVALVSEQMRLRRLSLSTSSSDRVLQQMTPSMSRKIIGAEAVDGDMMDDGWNGRGWKKSGPRIFVFAFVFRQRPAAVPTNLASDTRVRTCSETVPKSQPRTGHTREPDPTHLKLKHETTRGTPTHESTHQTDLTHTHLATRRTMSIEQTTPPTSRPHSLSHHRARARAPGVLKRFHTFRKRTRPGAVCQYDIMHNMQHAHAHAHAC